MVALLKAAVVGVGNMGRHHARIYSELPDVELVAICDLNKERGNEYSKKFNCNYYEDYHDLLNNKQIDLVSIAVPTVHHKKIALDFLNKGIHVLVEKPICNTIADARELIAAAKKNNVLLLVGHVERYNPAVIKLKEMIEEGIFGDLISINAKRVGGYPSQIRDSDVIIDVAIHDIDLFNFLYGSTPDAVFSNKGIAFGGGKADYVDILMNYGGKTGFIQCNWITPVKIRTLTITGTKAYAELNYITQELKLFETQVIKAVDDFGDFIIKFGNPNVMNITVEKEEPLKLELLNFISAIQKGERLKISPEEALKALEVVLKI